MQGAGYGLPRIPLLRTRVNRNLSGPAQPLCYFVHHPEQDSCGDVFALLEVPPRVDPRVHAVGVAYLHPGENTLQSCAVEAIGVVVHEQVRREGLKDLLRYLRRCDPQIQGGAVLAQGVRYGLPVHEGPEDDQDPHASLVPILRAPGPGAVEVGLGDLRYPDPHLLERQPRRFAPGTRPRLLVDVRQVTLDGTLSEVHLGGYLVVGEAPGYVHQDLRLPLRERTHRPIAHPLQGAAGHRDHRVLTFWLAHEGLYG